MNTRTKDSELVQLASKFTSADYEKAVELQDRKILIDFIHRRFCERYIRPIGGINRHGFTIMAVCCLMIEALVSFRNGWNTTAIKGHEAFELFFKENDAFATLVPLVGQFYGHVRSALFHQAETTGGWRIRRDGRPLFDEAHRTIEADKFRAAMSVALDSYCEELTRNDWDSEIWKNLRRKVDSICKNATYAVQ